MSFQPRLPFSSSLLQFKLFLVLGKAIALDQKFLKLRLGKRITANIFTTVHEAMCHSFARSAFKPQSKHFRNIQYDRKKQWLDHGPYDLDYTLCNYSSYDKSTIVLGCLFMSLCCAAAQLSNSCDVLEYDFRKLNCAYKISNIFHLRMYSL